MNSSDAPLGSRAYLDTNLYIYLFGEALAYNGLVQRWPGISRLAAADSTEQGALFGAAAGDEA